MATLRVIAALVASMLVLACSRDRPRVQPAELPSVTPVLSAPAATTSAEAPPESLDAGACVVAIRSLVDASIGRGSGADTRNLNERSKGLDFGVQHLSCTYAVSVNGVGYRYRYNAERNFTNRGIDTKKCADESVRRAAVSRIVQFTEQCRDLRAGEASGDRLDRE